MTEQTTISGPTATPATVHLAVSEGRAFNRRRLALQFAAQIAAGQQVRRYDADSVVAMAGKFDAFLKGGA